LAAVKKIRDEQKISGVYGPLLELFECDEVYMTAVESAVGSALFHVVVDTDDTASKLLESMKQQKSGRVTFIPLNRIEVKTPKQSPQSTQNCFPMIDKLQFKPALKKAIQEIFGKIWICDTLDVGLEYATNYGLNCITLDGEQINKKGVLQGGFVDVKVSRLRAIKSIKQLRRKLETTSSESKKNKIFISRT